MEVLRKQIRRAQRRLIGERFLRRLSACWTVALLVAAVAIAVRKIWVFGVDGPLWSAAWIGGSLLAGLCAALVWSWVRRQTPIEAALEIDRRFGLKERVSSSLALTPAERETEAGQALISDALRRVDQLDVAERFVVRPNRWSLLPLAPGLAAFLLVMFVADKGSEATTAAKTADASSAQVKKSAQALEKKLEDRRREARKQGLADAADLFKKLEQGTKELGDKDQLDRKKALVKLNDLAKDMEQRRQSLTANDRLKQQFNQLKDLRKGPADKLAKALKHGDFKQAVKELEQLKQRLAKNDLKPKEKQQLAEQAEQMRQALDKLAQAREQAKQDLERQVEQARQAGRTDEAQKAQQQLDKLKQDAPQTEKLSQMAQQLGKAAEGLKQGDSKAAQQALDKVGDQLAEMQQAGDEMAMLDEALEELAEAKDAMGCKQCNGEGCEHCQGQGQAGKPGQRPGNGLGKGRGQGPRPEQKGKTGFYDSNVRQNVGKGGAVVTDMVDGPSRKGEVREEIKAQFESSKREAEDPLTGQRLPRDYREHAKTYFDAVREGQAKK